MSGRLKTASICLLLGAAGLIGCSGSGGTSFEGRATTERNADAIDKELAVEVPAWDEAVAEAESSISRENADEAYEALEQELARELSDGD